MNELGCVVAIPVVGFGGFEPGGGALEGVCEGPGVFVTCTIAGEGPDLLGGCGGGGALNGGGFVAVLGATDVDAVADLSNLGAGTGGRGASADFILGATGVGDSCVCSGGKGVTRLVLGVSGTVGVSGTLGEGSTFDGPAVCSCPDSLSLSGSVSCTG